MRNLALFTMALVLAAACSAEESRPETLTLASHNSFVDAVTDETFAAFTEDTGIEVEVVGAGDAGSLVNQTILSKDNPFADVLFGVDDTFLSRAVDEGIFESYDAGEGDILVEGVEDPSDLVTPISYGDVCLNYDIGWFEDSDRDVPDEIEDLREPRFAELTTVEHPATSSPGLAFLLATIEEYGEDGWKDFWADLRDGGVNVVADWDTAYYGDFTRYGGDSPLVVSYASSPPAEVIFAEQPLETAPTGVIEDGCYRQVEYAGVLAGTEHPDAAGELIEFMLSTEFQETIPLNWFVFPANRDAELPEEFREHTVIPDDPAQLPAETVADNREQWISEWVTLMEG